MGEFEEALKTAIDIGWVTETEDEQWGKEYNLNVLLTCPFCGGAPRLNDTGEYAWVDCLECGNKSKAIQKEHGKDKIYTVIPIVLWNQSYGGEREEKAVGISGNKESGLQEKEYWKLLDKRLRSEGIHL